MSSMLYLAKAHSRENDLSASILSHNQPHCLFFLGQTTSKCGFKTALCPGTLPTDHSGSQRGGIPGFLSHLTVVVTICATRSVVSRLAAATDLLPMQTLLFGSGTSELHGTVQIWVLRMRKLRAVCLWVLGEAPACCQLWACT